MVADPDGAIAQIYREIARKVAIFVAQKAEDFSAKFPSIVIQNTWNAAAAMRDGAVRSECEHAGDA